MLDIFWSTGADSLNYYKELTIQVRIHDSWYNAFLAECRAGNLSEEMYNLLMGFPTCHAGSWEPCANGREKVACGNAACLDLPARSTRMARNRSTWPDMQALECELCSEERRRRNRLIESNDARVYQEPFLSAPYVHQNNEPKYHAMLLRAVELAKRAPGGPKYVLWVTAQDTVHNPQEIASSAAQVDKQRRRFLQFHDQRTAGSPGLLPLYVGLQARVTEKMQKVRGSRS